MKSQKEKECCIGLDKEGGKLSDITKQIEILSRQYKELLERVDELESENKRKDIKIFDLEKKIYGSVKQ